jgi:hypothetical protein
MVNLIHHNPTQANVAVKWEDQQIYGVAITCLIYWNIRWRNSKAKSKATAKLAMDLVAIRDVLYFQAVKCLCFCCYYVDYGDA